MVGPVDTVTLLYSPVQLTCEAVGQPLPVVRWYKDGVAITPHNEHTPTLEILELNIDDRGFYYCSASSVIGGNTVSVFSPTVLVSIEGKLNFNQA